MFFFLDASSSVVALCVFFYMLRDPRMQPDHERIVYFIPVRSCTITSVKDIGIAYLEL